MATLIGELKTIGLEGEKIVENWLLKTAGQIKNSLFRYQELVLKYLLPPKMMKDQLQA